MQLSAQTIEQFALDGMITPFQRTKLIVRGKSQGLSAASYDMAIGHSLKLGIHPGYVMRDHILARRPLVNIRTGMATEELYRKFKKMPPCCALASTVENLNIPPIISVSVANKSTQARMFLRIDNTFIDPGFIGNLTVEFVNHSDRPIDLVKGEPVCQLLFKFLDHATAIPYGGKFQNQTAEPHGPRYELEEGKWIEFPR